MCKTPAQKMGNKARRADISGELLLILGRFLLKRSVGYALRRIMNPAWVNTFEA